MRFLRSARKGRNSMDDRSRNNRNVPKGTGTFKLNIDENKLATGPVPVPERKREASASYAEPPMNKKIYYTEKERRAEEKAHKKRNKLKARKNRRVFSLVWLAMVLLVSFTLASYLIGGSNDFFAVGRNQGKAEVGIPANVTAEQLADILYQKGVISKKEFFTIYCKVTADMQYFQPGPYELATNLDYEDIINKLQGGNESRETVTVTFPEGYTVLQVAQLLEENEVCSAQEFLDILNSGDFSGYPMVAQMGDASGKYYKLEGYLFPDTYDFYKGEELADVVGKLLTNFEKRLTDDLQTKIANSGMSLDQVVTLASIIQAEAANTNDMYNVSAVLHNRLSFGVDYGVPMLQCDSTMFYPYKTRADIPEQGALPHGNYDTYEITGLPAGAICNPGLDAIKAALQPNTDGDAAEYLYFCHSADGTAYYATNEEDHLANLVEAGLTD